MIVKTINENLSVACETYSNSRGWGHIVKALWNGREVAERRVKYYNRTWEAYQYQSALQMLVDKMDAEKTIPLKDRLELSRFLAPSRMSL